MYLEKLRQLRKEKGLSMKQLGDVVGVGEAAISAYELGKNEPSLDVLCQLADYFNVSLDMLVRGKEKDRPTKEQSIKEMLEMYGQMTDAELELIRALITAALADRRYKESLDQAGQE